MNPARNSNRGLGTSASAGSSRNVLNSRADIRINMRSRLAGCRDRHDALMARRVETILHGAGELALRGRSMAWRSLVAMGDSFTEGMNDPYPDGTYRGWADLVAARLAAESGPDSGYANLAIRGRLVDQVLGEQLEPVLAMKPDLVSFAAGGNDVLRP